MFSSSSLSLPSIDSSGGSSGGPPSPVGPRAISLATGQASVVAAAAIELRKSNPRLRQSEQKPFIAYDQSGASGWAVK